MPLSVAAASGRAAFAGSVRAFLEATVDLGDEQLLKNSRCNGWTRLDVVVHVLTGWQELLGGLACRTSAPSTVDAASYWTAFTSAASAHDPIDGLMAQRRRAAAYARPTSAVIHLRAVADVVLRASHVGDQACAFQGEVLTAGDLLATWAVENVIHQWDLGTPQPLPQHALALARSTVEVLAGRSLTSNGDLEVVLAGSGRRPVPASWAEVGGLMPVLG